MHPFTATCHCYRVRTPGHRGHRGSAQIGHRQHSGLTKQHSGCAYLRHRGSSARGRRGPALTRTLPRHRKWFWTGRRRGCVPWRRSDGSARRGAAAAGPSRDLRAVLERARGARLQLGQELRLHALRVRAAGVLQHQPLHAPPQRGHQRVPAHLRPPTSLLIKQLCDLYRPDPGVGRCAPCTHAPAPACRRARPARHAAAHPRRRTWVLASLYRTAQCDAGPCVCHNPTRCRRTRCI